MQSHIEASFNILKSSTKILGINMAVSINQYMAESKYKIKQKGNAME